MPDNSCGTEINFVWILIIFTPAHMLTFLIVWNKTLTIFTYSRWINWTKYIIMLSIDTFMQFIAIYVTNKNMISRSQNIFAKNGLLYACKQMVHILLVYLLCSLFNFTYWCSGAVFNCTNDPSVVSGHKSHTISQPRRYVHLKLQFSAPPIIIPGALTSELGTPIVGTKNLSVFVRVFAENAIASSSSLERICGGANFGELPRFCCCSW